MIAVVIALVAAQPVSVFLLVRYLRDRDRAERRERASLLQRIQAPEIAVAEHGAKGPSLPAVGIENDDEFWQAREAELNGGS